MTRTCGNPANSAAGPSSNVRLCSAPTTLSLLAIELALPGALSPSRRVTERPHSLTYPAYRLDRRPALRPRRRLLAPAKPRARRAVFPPPRTRPRVRLSTGEPKFECQGVWLAERSASRTTAGLGFPILHRRCAHRRSIASGSRVPVVPRRIEVIRRIADPLQCRSVSIRGK